MSADTLQTGAVRRFVEKSGEFQRRADRKKKGDRKPKMNDVEEKVEANLEFNEHRITVEEVIKQHNTDFERGLTTEEANRRLEEFGENALTPPEKIPEWKKFIHHQIGFFSLLLWAGALLCLISYFIDPNGVDNLYLGIVLAVVVFFTGVFAYAQERKSDQLMDSFSSLSAEKCRVRRDNTTFAIDALNLVPGDIVIIQQGEKIPADVRMVKMSNFKVNNSSLTGESEAQARITKAEPQQDNPLEAKNIAFLGTLAQEGTCEGIIIKTGDNTVIGSIAILAQQEEENKPPIQIEIEHFVKIVSGVAIFLGVLFLIIGIANGFDLLDSIVFMIGIIVANVPEGLLATVTLSLALTAKQMFNKKVMVKNLQSVETLGSTTVIASDKTGTLTMNRMTVAHVYYDNKIKLSKGLGEGVYDKDSKTFQMLMKIGVLCNDCEFEDTIENNETPLEWKTTQGGNATEAGFIKFFEQTRPIVKTREDNGQRAKVPFSSSYKFMISINHDGNNEKEDSLLLMKGAPEIVFNKCSKILLDGEIVDINDHRKAYDEARQALCFGGERVIGCAFRTLDVQKFGKDTGFKFETEGGEFNFPTDDLVFVGLVSLIDPPRPAVPGAVLNCQSAGIKVVMVTGDHPDTAEAIAKQVHIIKDKTRRDLANERGCDIGDVDPDDPEIKALVITGKELAQFDEDGIELDNALDYDQLVFARTTPQQKYQIVEGLQNKKRILRGHPAPGKPIKHIVAVTGDGVNDSPALNLADIGVAMGIEGTSVAKDAADMILLDDNFASIVKGVEEGRRIFDNLKKSIAYTLSSNIPEITPFISFIVLGIPLPLPTVLILFIDLGTDLIPAISLAYERKEDDIMKRPPRDARTDRLVTTKLISFSYLQIGVIQALAGFFTYFVVMNDYGFPPSILFGRGSQWETASVISNPADDGSMWLFYDNEFVSRVGDCTYPEDVACWNPLEALRFAQSAYFVSIVLVQWADLLICKTRMLSIRQQGMSNVVLNFGLLSETVIAVFLSYFEPINVVGTRPIRFAHWLAPLPFTMVIFLYDETRKYLMRSLGKQSWIYKNTYY